jgi:hypothetical protein
MRIKKFSESLLSKSDFRKELGDVIIQFLISKEKELGDMFDTYEIVGSESGVFIKAPTKANYRGVPPNKSVYNFSFEEFIIWFAGVRSVSSTKDRILSSIIDDIGNRGEPDSTVKLLLDAVVGLSDSWECMMEKIDYVKRVVSKYDVEMMDLRATEFYDDLIRWKPTMRIGIGRVIGGRNSSSTYKNTPPGDKYPKNFLEIDGSQDTIGLCIQMIEDYRSSIKDTPCKYSKFVSEIIPMVFLSFNIEYSEDNTTIVSDDKYTVSHCFQTIQERMYPRMKRLYPGIVRIINSYDHLSGEKMIGCYEVTFELS